MWRPVGGAETQNKFIPHPLVAIENQEGYLSYRRLKGASPTWGSPAQSSSAGQQSPYGNWL